MRGKDLDLLIEKELQLMIIEGFEKSPISHKALHTRLLSKGYINGSLSTLSTPERKKLIMLYMSSQLEYLNLNLKDKQQYLNKKTRSALTNANKSLRDDLTSTQDELHQNTETLIAIINEVKAKTNLKIEHLLAPHLLEKYLKSK